MRELDFKAFELAPEWQMIKTHLQAKKDDYVRELVSLASKGNASETFVTAGRLAEIEELLTLPEYLYSVTRKESR